MPSDARKNDLERLIAQRAEIERQLREHHSQELAILFSDIVGSTEIFEQKGDIEGLAMVRRHNGILFPVVEAHRGRVVKTIGDAIMAVFEMPADGVRCAADMQRALDEARKRDPDAAGIHIRIGVHAGRAMLDEGDVFGDAVNTAARIVGKAGGDEVLLSASLFGLVPHGEGLVAEARGTVSLKGKAEPLPIMALDWRAARPAERGAPPEIFVLDLALGRSGLKVAVLDGAGDKGPLRSYAELPLDRAGLDALAHRFDAFLDGQSASYLDGLEKAGRELHDTALSDRAKRHLASTSLHFVRLHVDDALAHVPYELAHDGTDFLSLRFATGRVVSTASDDDELEPSEAHVLRAGVGHALVVSDPSGDLPGARREGEAVEGLLRDGFGGEVRHLAGPVTRDALLEALPGCRLLHFAGHHMPSETGGFALADGILTPAEVASALKGTPPEAVFANGCHAGGRAGFTEGARRASGLAAALLLHGVRHFVGPMGEIPDADALSFALRFYESLLGGVPYGEAVRLSREALRGAGAEPLSFGRYLLYGEPRTALDPSLARLRAGPATRAFPPRPIAEPAGAGAPAPAPVASAASGATRSRGRMPIFVAAGGMAVVIGAILGLHLWPGASRARSAVGGTGGGTTQVTPTPPTPPTPAKAAPEKTPIAPRTGPVALAVLPFKNLTGDAKLDYLEQGLTESVITGFAGAKNLHLIEHAQIDKDVHYEEWTHSKYVDPATRAKIGKIVGCEAVVLGGYQRSGKTVRATARIIRVDTGEILAAAKVERPISKVFDLQDAVAKQLRGDLPRVQAALRP